MNTTPIYSNMDNTKTRILIVDHDEASFHVRQCIASVSSGLNTLDLIYAKDASEALNIIDKKNPDVILFNADENIEELELLLENLNKEHPPIVLQGDFDELTLPKTDIAKRIPNDESIDAIHQTLKLVSTIAENNIRPRDQEHYH